MQVRGKGIQAEGTQGLQVRWVVGAEGRGLQRMETRGLEECLAVGVQGRGSGDDTTVDRMKGKGLRGKTERKALGTINGRAFGDPR